VDIGGNDGTLAKGFQDFGFSVLNVEPSNVAKLSVAKEVPTMQAFFDQRTAASIKTAHGQAALVTCNNCFAHMPNIEEVIEGVQLLLVPKGWFVIESADLEATLRKRLFDQFYHEHVFYWHKAALTMLLESEDFMLETWEENAQQGGSFRATFSNRAGLKLRNEIEPGKVALKEGFRKLRQFIDEWSKDTLARLKEIPADASIACYGWPAKATLISRLLHLSGISYVVDSTTVKQGLFTPGAHFPIVPPSRFLEEPPDYCIITATNYAKKIKAANPQFKGVWVELMPGYE
jgi:hypothetical protein